MTGTEVRVALITGCSTGIGRATALRLDASGWSVYAGVRRQEDADSLAAAGSERLTPLIIDVTDPGSIAAAAERVEAESAAGLGALVNNAGVAYTGPLEFVPLDELRNQLEVNVTGHVAITQALIPALRRARGRIVNITSIGGIVATPFFGPYNASKYALEAISDCLRVELRPWGIETIAIEPGSISTEIWSSGLEQFDRTEERMPAEAQTLYGKAIKGLRRAARETGERGIPADHAAAVIEKALVVSRPRARYLIGRDARVMATLSRVLPDRLWDRAIGRIMGLP
ncbi:MAG TPA: SDR family oxidoreductase [Solirubrobacterales bacterium]|jgi:NAD(P)-dependent dehydrogenase (short-subunit alcohol dehydrogenase family)|nr:SDR family oxidoreductase [Solirubrobacterales bacterium]